LEKSDLLKLLGIWGRELKENDGGGELKYNIFDIF
jgi:hypothetical protein